MRVCFVGIGSIARRHIGNLIEICEENNIDVQIDALRRKASNNDDLPKCIKHSYTSIDEMPKNYDVIFLTNPTEYHADMLLALHNHSKHFFIEKPVTSLNTIKKLEEFEYRKDSVYYVACPLRYTSVIQYIKNSVDLNSVNSVRSISSSYLPDWRPGVDYRQTYSAHSDLGGGVSIDLIHEWDYLTYLFGMPDMVSMFKGKISDLEIDSDDYAIYIAKYESMIAELHLDYFGRKTIRKIELYTDKETIVGDLVEGVVKYLKSDKIVDLQEDRDIYQKRELRYFINIITKGSMLENDIENAVKVLKLTQGSLG